MYCMCPNERSIMNRWCAVTCPSSACFDLLDFGCQSPMRQRRNLLHIRCRLVHQRLKHSLAGNTKHVTENRSQFNVGVFQQLLNAIAFRGSVGQQLLPIASQIAQFANVAWWNEAGPYQSVPQITGYTLSSLLSVFSPGRDRTCFALAKTSLILPSSTF